MIYVFQYLITPTIYMNYLKDGQNELGVVRSIIQSAELFWGTLGFYKGKV